MTIRISLHSVPDPGSTLWIPLTFVQPWAWVSVCVTLCVCKYVNECVESVQWECSISAYQHSKTSWDAAVECSVAILRFVNCQRMENWKRGTWVGMRYSCFYLSWVKILFHKIHCVQWVVTRNESAESSPVFPRVFSGTVHVSLRRMATLHSVISCSSHIELGPFPSSCLLSPHRHFCPLSPFSLFSSHSMGRIGRAQAAWLTALNWNPYSAPSHYVVWFWGEFTLLSKHVSSSLNGICHVYLSGLLWGSNELMQATCMVLNEINILLN